jgi:hypothetical protein
VAVINRRDPGVLVGETPCLKCRASRLLKADVQQVFIVLSLHGQIGGIVVRQTDIHLGELHFKPERGESSNIPVERVEVVELVEAGADMELKPDTNSGTPRFTKSFAMAYTALDLRLRTSAPISFTNSRAAGSAACAHRSACSMVRVP